jgi:hypothetical protein
VLAQGVPAQPDEGAFRGASGNLPVRSVSAVASAMAGSTKARATAAKTARRARARPAPAEILRALRLRCAACYFGAP